MEAAAARGDPDFLGRGVAIDNDFAVVGKLDLENAGADRGKIEVGAACSSPDSICFKAVSTSPSNSLSFIPFVPPSILSSEKRICVFISR